MQYLISSKTNYFNFNKAGCLSDLQELNDTYQKFVESCLLQFSEQTAGSLDIISWQKQLKCKVLNNVIFRNRKVREICNKTKVFLFRAMKEHSLNKLFFFASFMANLT